MAARFLFRRQVWRHARRHPALAILNALAVALGVAVFVAVRMANAGAARGFEAGIDLTAGKAQLEVRGPVDDSLFPAIEHSPGVRAATPVIEELAATPDYPGEYLRVLGVDVFTNEPFRTFEIGGGSFDIEPWLANPHGIAVSDEFAQARGLKAGGTLRLEIDSQPVAFTILALIPLRNLPAGAAGVPIAAMDIGWAQENFHLRGRLGSVQLLLDDPAHPEAAQQGLAAIVPPDARVEAPGQRSLQIDKMLGAFRLNLTALSLVSLLVGMFLVYNTLFASAARRRVEIGILRALGATRWEVRGLFLGEALLFGICGVLGGIAGGMALARGLDASVARSVSSIYSPVRMVPAGWSEVPFAAALAAGLASVLAGAWVPANEAAMVDPVVALSHGARLERFHRGHLLRWTAAGLAMLGLAWVCSAAALRTAAWLSFGAAFFVLIGFAFFAPGISAAAGRVAAATGNTLVRMAGENVRRTIHRSAVTVAALACAVAMMTGVSTMIFSFRRSVEEWIARGLTADLILAPASNEAIGANAFLPAEVLQALAHDPGIVEANTYRAFSAPLADGGEIEMAAVTGAERRRLRFVGGGDEAKMREFFAGSVIVTESFARRHAVSDGDALPIRTPEGIEPFRVAGVYYDYTSDRGLVMIDRATFDRWWNEPGVNSCTLFLRPGADAKAVAARLKRQFAGDDLLIYSNAELRGRILSIFDQTFAVTEILRTIAVIVAVVGLFLSLTALVIEREREIGLLRALGASRGQVGAMLLSEAALLGAVSAALGVASGLGLAMVLTWVVNKAFFGWTIELRLPLLFIATTPLWIVGAAVLAALLPARQAARVPIAAALREE